MSRCRPAIVVQIFEELFPAQLLAALDDASNALVGNGYRVLNAALSLELEPHLVSDDGDVPSAERGKAEGFVGFPVFVRADTNEGCFQQPDDGGHDLVAREAGQRDIRFDALADLPQHVAELEHPLEFRAVAVLPELRMVAVLFAAAAVARRHLEMAVFVRTDPHVGPRRRNHEHAKTAQRIAGTNHFAVGSDVRETTSVTVTADSRHRITDVSQTRRDRGPHVFVRNGLPQLSSSGSRAR